jgi:hypothetical protein
MLKIFDEYQALQIEVKSLHEINQKMLMFEYQILKFLNFK